jgi:hypothetical protein
MPRKPQRKHTWPGLDPGEGSPFDDETEHDGELMDVERKEARDDTGKKRPAKGRDHADRPPDRRGSS